MSRPYNELLRKQRGYEQGQKIYVGNSSVFHSFEMNEVDPTCEFVKILTETTCNEFIRNPEAFKQLIEEPRAFAEMEFLVMPEEI